MSLYRQGISSNPFQKGYYNPPYGRGNGRYRSGLTHVGGPWVSTPGLVADEISKLQDDVRATDREIYHWLDEHGAFPSTGTLDDRPPEILPAVTFYEGTWSEFLRSWEDFMTDKSAWYNRLWGYNYGAVQDWRKKLIDLRTAWKNNIGVEFVGPEPAAPKDADWGVFSLLKTLAIAAIVVVGGVIVIWLFGQLRGSGPSFQRTQPILIQKGA